MRHTGEPAETAAAGKAEQHGLRLIIEGVRRHDVRAADAERLLGQQAVARFPRRRLQTGLRLRAVPTQRAVGDFKLAGDAFDRRRFARGFRPQPMIDGGGR